MCSLVNRLYRRSAVAAIEFAFCFPVFFMAIFLLINLAFAGYNLYAMKISAMNSAIAIANEIDNSIWSGQNISSACPTSSTLNTIFQQNSVLSKFVFYGTISYNVSFGGDAAICGTNNGYVGDVANVTVTESIQLPLVFERNIFGSFAPLTVAYTVPVAIH